MSQNSSLAKKPSPTAIAVDYFIKKFRATRYLLAIAYGYLRFDANGLLICDRNMFIKGTTVAINTAGAATYTAANILSGLIARDCAGAGRTDTTDTAVNLIAGLKLTADYDEAFFTIVNTTGGAFTITLAGGTGVTLKGALTVAQFCSARFAIMRTSSTLCCIREV